VFISECAEPEGEVIPLLAPDLIWAEVANALWRKWREKELTAEEVESPYNREDKVGFRCAASFIHWGSELLGCWLLHLRRQASRMERPEA
jgi:hypothetical protein